MQWNEDASAYLESYLSQIRRVCGERGEDAPDAEKRVRQRIESILAEGGVSVATVDQWHMVVCVLGTPESVVAHLGPPPLPPGGRWVEVEPLPVRIESRRISGRRLLALNVLLLLFVGVAGIVISHWMPDPVSRIGRGIGERFTCEAQMKRIFSDFERYSAEHNGAMPPLPPALEALMVFPNSNPIVYQCPAAGPRYERTDNGIKVSGSEYVYLGYNLRSAADLNALATVYMKCQGNEQAIAALGPISGTQGEVVLLRSDLPEPATVPLLVEKGLNHIPEGGNVLYLDGHVEYVSLDEKFPMTTEFFRKLQEMENAWLSGHPSQP